MTTIDHITIAAHTLEQGVAYVADALGIEPPPGGAHPRMGTHNHLLRLGESLFLEVIAVDPLMPAPSRPRWFQLDDPVLQAQLRIKPRLLTWVARPHDIAASMLASSVPLGALEVMTRGALRWLISFPEDGSLPEQGLIPSLIKWTDGPHPATRMPELDCFLERFEARHPDPAAYRAQLASIGAAHCIEILQADAGSAAQLRAWIRTPHGVRMIA